VYVSANSFLAEEVDLVKRNSIPNPKCVNK